MTPNFPETNEALYHTLYYFKIGRIDTQIKKMAGGLNLGYLDSYHEVALRSHKDMENEINQNAIGSIHFIKQSLFEYLRDWLNSWQFNPGFEKEIEWLIDRENEKELARYKAEIENDEIEYKKTIPEGIEEGQEYEVHFKPYYDIFIKAMRPARTEKRINKFITTKKPDTIDKSYLPEYVLLVKNLTDSFRRHSEKYVRNYFEGKYPDPIGLLPNIPIKKDLLKVELPSPTTPPESNKVRVQLTAGQLLYLFQTLREIGVFGQISQIDTCRIMEAHFSTKDYEDLSADSQSKKWNEINTNDIAFWFEQYPEMAKKVIKDHPTKIPYKNLRTK